MNPLFDIKSPLPLARGALALVVASVGAACSSVSDQAKPPSDLLTSLDRTAIVSVRIKAKPEIRRPLNRKEATIAGLTAAGGAGEGEALVLYPIVAPVMATSAALAAENESAIATAEKRLNSLVARTDWVGVFHYHFQQAVTAAAGRPVGTARIRQAAYQADEGILSGTGTPYRFWREAPHVYTDLIAQNFRYVLEVRIYGISLMENDHWTTSTGPVNRRLHPGYRGRISIIDVNRRIITYSVEFDHTTRQAHPFVTWAEKGDDYIKAAFANAANEAALEIANALFHR